MYIIQYEVIIAAITHHKQVIHIQKKYNFKQLITQINSHLMIVFKKIFDLL